ncbi:MAG: peptidylprolyl isomerase [Sulfitobacter sp.]
MQKHLKSLACAFLMATLAAPVSAQDDKTDRNTVVATVNGTEITVGHMIVAYATLPEQYRQLSTDVLFKGILDQLVQQTALSQSFAGDIPNRIELSLENERRSLIAGEVVEGVLAEALTDEAVQELFDAQFAGAEPTEEFNAAHILVETEEAANAIKADLDGGADFAETAKEKSTGPSGPNGGSLGWFGPGMMVPEFEAATVALKPGEISDPVKTQFGWHVIQLIETRNAEIPKLEDVREDLENQVRQKAVETALTDVTEAADVDRSGAEGINPDILGKIELLD